MMNRNMMKQVQQLQAKMAKAQEELGNEQVEGTAGGGAVRVVLTGHQKMSSISIEPEAAEDIEMLQDMIVTAFNDAQEKVGQLVTRKMSPFTGGMPGLF